MLTRFREFLSIFNSHFNNKQKKTQKKQHYYASLFVLKVC